MGKAKLLHAAPRGLHIHGARRVPSLKGLGFMGFWGFMGSMGILGLMGLWSLWDLWGFWCLLAGLGFSMQEHGVWFYGGRRADSGFRILRFQEFAGLGLQAK